MFKIPKVQWPVFDSIRQCAAATKVPASILALSKASGCPAFAHGRIRFGEWIAWHFSQKKTKAVLPAGFSSWRDYLNSVSAKRQELALARDKDEVLDKADVGEAITRGISVLFDSIHQTFLNQFPAQVVGMTEIQISAKCKALIEQLEDQCREDLTKLAEKKV